MGKRSSSERTCQVTSVLVCNDVLLLGSDCGGICVMDPDQVRNHQNDSKSSHLLCTVLRHQNKCKFEDVNGSRSRSLSSVSNLDTSSSLRPSIGVIPRMVLANNHVVSLYQTNETFIR